MSAHPMPTRASDLPQLSAFLRAVFRAPPEARFAAEDVLAWKYLRCDPIWEGGLSYVLQKNGGLAAHAGVCPVLFRRPDGQRVKCATVIDWAADRGTPGAGLVVHHEVMRRAESMFLIGGTETTWAITSKLGFRPVLEARVYARWVRPLKEFWLRPKTGRTALRLLHGLAHAPFGRLAKAGRWEISRVPRFDETTRSVLTSGPRPYGVAERTVAQLNHRLQCPAVATRGYVLRRLDKIEGYAIASVGTWEAKIVDIRLQSDDPQDWAAAYALVTDTLRREPAVCRISALASVPPLRKALEANSYWVSRVEPVSFYDPKRLVDGLLPVDIQFFESDLSYYGA